MTRRLLNLLTSTSLLALSVVLCLWVRSAFRADHVAYGTAVGRQRHSFITLDLYTGNVRLYWAHYRFPPAARLRFAAVAQHGRLDPSWSWTVMRYDDPRHAPRFVPRLHWNLGVPRLWTDHSGPNLWGVGGVSVVTRMAEVPFWTLAAPFAVLPLARVGRNFRAARRTRSGLCPACGYDLRATPGRCPECGTIAAPAP